MAREAAYTEDVPLVGETGTKLLSTQPPRIENDVSETGQKPSLEKALLTKLVSDDIKNQTLNNMRLDINTSWQNRGFGNSEKTGETTSVKPKRTEEPNGGRFMAWAMNQKTDSYQENEFDYSDKKSSTLDKYEPSDALKDWLLPSDGAFDVVGDFKNKDYLSALIDVVRATDPKTEIGKDAARAVWKAGSEFYLRPKGWDISADMLEHSLQEKPKDVVFYEDSDVVKQIKNNSGFITHLDEVVYKKENNIPLTEEDKQHNFEASDNQDLYYSIHGCHFDIDNISYNEDGTRDISVHISDNYDYTKIWTSMDGKEFSPSRISLGTIANDMGTITSKIDAINPYKVDIYFTIRR